jgi:hypothetical protein
MDRTELLNAGAGQRRAWHGFRAQQPAKPMAWVCTSSALLRLILAADNLMLDLRNPANYYLRA